jgi:hypothetical protein
VLVSLILRSKIKETSTRSKYFLVVSGEKGLFTQPQIFFGSVGQKILGTASTTPPPLIHYQ